MSSVALQLWFGHENVMISSFTIFFFVIQRYFGLQPSLWAQGEVLLSSQLKNFTPPTLPVGNADSHGFIGRQGDQEVYPSDSCCGFCVKEAKQILKG